MRFLLVLLSAAFLSLTSALPVQAQSQLIKNVTTLSQPMSIPTEPIVYADGRQGSLADFRGDVLIVTLWQVHCPICQREMPVLNQLSKDMANEGVKVVALGLDQNMPQIEQYMARFELDGIQPIMDLDKFNGLLLSVEHFGRMSIATPTSFIVDKNGQIVARAWGLVDWTGEPAKNYLRSLAAS